MRRIVRAVMPSVWSTAIALSRIAARSASWPARWASR
jgi:hypothetical protein